MKLDNTTLELAGLPPVPKKRGRPSTGKALTNAQKQAAHRERQKRLGAVLVPLSREAREVMLMLIESTLKDLGFQIAVTDEHQEIKDNYKKSLFELRNYLLAIKPKEAINDKISELNNLPVKVQSFCRNEGILTIQDLSNKTELQLLKISNCGKVTIKHLKNLLLEYGLDFQKEKN